MPDNFDFTIWQPAKMVLHVYDADMAKRNVRKNSHFIKVSYWRKWYLYCSGFYINLMLQKYQNAQSTEKCTEPVFTKSF